MLGFAWSLGCSNLDPLFFVFPFFLLLLFFFLCCCCFFFIYLINQGTQEPVRGQSTLCHEWGLVSGITFHFLFHHFGRCACKLAKSSTDDVPWVDTNNPGARIITFCPFYFSLGFTFSLSKFFWEVFYAIGCALSQCTSDVYWVVICFENLDQFFRLGLTVWDFFYFFEVSSYEKNAQVCVCNTNLFGSLSFGEYVWQIDVLDVSDR